MKNRYLSLNTLSGLYLSMFPRLLESSGLQENFCWNLSVSFLMLSSKQAPTSSNCFLIFVWRKNRKINNKIYYQHYLWQIHEAWTLNTKSIYVTVYFIFPKILVCELSALKTICTHMYSFKNKNGVIPTDNEL